MLKRNGVITGNSIRTAFILTLSATICTLSCNTTPPPATTSKPEEAVFVAPDTNTIPHDKFGDLVRYGRDLVINTAYYIGPNGTKGHYLGNKMNCTNCHVDAGTRPFAFNFFSSYPRYPQYRGRENEILTLGQRINNCIMRPHSGTPLPLDSKEIVAMVCYMKWISTGVPVGGHVKGDESLEIEKYPARAADPKRGEAIFNENCTSCHGKDGQGQWTPDSATYVYPPLWGPHAYQVGSSPSRVVKMARFIKANMPDKKAFWYKPFLTDEQAIDVAAFINDDSIHVRPTKKDKSVVDYPDYSKKAIDYGIGPFIDTFSALQHKYGPYQPIIDYHTAHHLPVIW